MQKQQKQLLIWLETTLLIKVTKVSRPSPQNRSEKVKSETGNIGFNWEISRKIHISPNYWWPMIILIIWWWNIKMTRFLDNTPNQPIRITPIVKLNLKLKRESRVYVVTVMQMYLLRELHQRKMMTIKRQYLKILLHLLIAKAKYTIHIAFLGSHPLPSIFSVPLSC